MYIFYGISFLDKILTEFLSSLLLVCLWKSVNIIKSHLLYKQPKICLLLLSFLVNITCTDNTCYYYQSLQAYTYVYNIYEDPNVEVHHIM